MITPFVANALYLRDGCFCVCVVVNACYSTASRLTKTQNRPFFFLFSHFLLRVQQQVVPRLRKFNDDLKVLNTVLTDLITRARLSAEKADLEDLQNRNYDKASKQTSEGSSRYRKPSQGIYSQIPRDATIYFQT